MEISFSGAFLSLFSHDEDQGFPILKNGTSTSEYEIKCLLQMSIKVTHLLSNIANAQLVHQAEDGAIEPSQKTGH